MIKLEKFIKYLIIIIMLIMPILDTIFFFSRITTLAIILIIFFTLFLTLINNKKSRKQFLYLLIYYILCIIYLIINYVHSQGFNSLFPDNFNYSFYRELTTILKLMIPATLLFILRYNNITKKEYFSIIKYWIIFIGGTIILTNIFKISLSSYTNETITYNIFEWYKSVSYTLTASKGFFVYPNQEASILIMLLIMSIYMFFEQNQKNVLYILVLTITMIMLGTRVSTMGGLLVLITISLIIVLYKKIIEKKKLKKKYLYIFLPITLWILLMPISPYSNRNIELNKDYTKDNNYLAFVTTINDIKKEETKEDKMRKYIDENHIEEKLPERFYKINYSYNYDPYFWYELVKNTNPNDINYRMIEINIIKRINEVDNRKSNILFGISNSRIQNVINIERDFILHYYAYGIIGIIILLLIYPWLLTIILKKIIKKRNLIDILIFGLVVLFIFTAYLTGNIINFLTPLIPFVFITNIVFIDKKGKKN